MKTLKDWKKEIDEKINISRNEYIDGNFKILDKKYIKQLSEKAEKRILSKTRKVGVIV